MTQIKKSALTLLFAAYFASAFSQNASTDKIGLYKSEDDFILHKLTYGLDYRSISKPDFFGYHDPKGMDYRFYKNQLFEIVDTAAFTIYRRTALEPGTGGKGFATVTKYYFSRRGSELVQPLTVKNLEDAFPENTRFHYALESYARNDSGLIGYDPYLKSYKLKYLYAESLK
jgi:hypothetical protein